MAKKHSKNHINYQKKILDQQYSIDDALQILKENSKEQETLDVSFKLNIDATKSDQVVKGMVPIMPAGLGKKN